MQFKDTSSVKECDRCVMNSLVDVELTLNQQGVCNHCERYDELIAARVVVPEQRSKELFNLVEKIKKSGRGDYDCIVGVSGGVDSTYVAYLAKSLGLKPLAIHFDNGWNSELAVQNIQNVLELLEIDLVTYVIDWEEFRDLQRSFLMASTPDGEIPTDHAIYALLWREASARSIKYILSGMNFITESISVRGWSYGHSDWRYIKGIQKKFGTRRLFNYPHYSFLYLFYVTFFKRVRTVSILNYVDYDKDETLSLLKDKLGWIDYGGKHHESVYTRFYQGYFLPKKFNIDKRYGHYSDLINSGQLTREKAKAMLEQPPYAADLAARDLTYVSKKLGFTETEFESLLRQEPLDYRSYRNSYAYVQFLRRLVNKLRAWGLYPK